MVMKRLIALVLTAMLSLSVLVPVHAAEGAVVTAQKVAAKPGDTVTVDLTLSNNPGVAAIILTVRYDSSALTQSAAANGVLFESMEAGRNLVFASASDVTANGILATLTFKVADGASGTYPIEVIVREACNSKDEDVDFAAIYGAVSVQNSEVFSVRVNGEEKLAAAGDILSISAQSGYTERGLKYRFDRWTAIYATGEDASDIIADASRANTTVRVPSSSVDVNAQYYVLGDVDSNGRINARDVSKIMRARVGLESLDGIFAIADYNEDGKVNNRDILLMLLDIVNGTIE